MAGRSRDVGFGERVVIEGLSRNKPFGAVEGRGENVPCRQNSRDGVAGRKQNESATPLLTPNQ